MKEKLMLILQHIPTLKRSLSILYDDIHTFSISFPIVAPHKLCGHKYTRTTAAVAVIVSRKKTRIIAAISSYQCQDQIINGVKKKSRKAVAVEPEIPTG